MLFVVPFFLLLLLVIWGYVSSDLILKMTPNSVDFNPRSFGCDFEPFQARTEDGIAIDGWFIPAKKTSHATLFILHGWGANRSDVLPTTIFLADKYNLVYFDFRNHGRSGGTKTSLTCLEIRDFEAVVRYVKENKKEAAERMGVFGFSMGAAVAITGAAKMTELLAVAAESPFSDYNETVVRFAKLFFGIPRWTVPFTLFFARMRLGLDPEECSPIRHIAKLSPRPVLIFQGGKDERMPLSQGQGLYAAAGEPKEIWIVDEADHGAIHDSRPDEYRKRLAAFFEKWIKS